MKMLKGKLIVAQSGGPTAVINASLSGVIREARNHAEIESIYGLVHGIEGALNEEMVDLTQESQPTVELLIQTPGSALGSCRHKLSDDEYEQILNLFQAHNVRHFVYIGGNDSMDTCHRISALADAAGYDMQVMGVPKTVDNDLALTDHTPGYGSAARFIALAARDTGRDLEAMATFEDVSILESMGRNAGWLTASAALGKVEEDEAPHLVYVPEIAFDEAHFLDDVANVHRRLGRVFVVVCEGIRDVDGNFVGQHQLGSGSSDAFGHALPTLTAGVASYLSGLVSQRLALRSRFLRPVLIGRGFTACIAETDRKEAEMVGLEAVHQLADGQSGYMITLERISDAPYRSQTGLAPLAEVANAEKLLPRSFINEYGNNVTSGFIDYALPLIDGPFPPLARLKGSKVEKIISPAN
jgi:6-phosphofructokinase 1